MTTVGVFVPSGDAHHIKTLTAFYNAVKDAGNGVFVSPVDRYVDCDVAVVFGIYKKAVPNSIARGKIIETQRRQGKPVIVIDSGYLRREAYFMVGANGLNGYAEFFNKNMPSDRWDALALPINPWRTEGTHVLVCGQVPWDASVQHLDHTGWCRSVVAKLNRITNRPIRFRPHPKANGVNYNVGGLAETSTNEMLATDFVDCHAVVTQNSNAATDALLAGIPTITMEKGSMSWGYTGHDLTGIEDPLMLDRRQWACDLAFSQWRSDEFGKAWEHLKEGLEL